MQDRPVLVTGATGALGTAVCAHLLEAGAIVHATHVLDDEAARFDATFAQHRGRFVLHWVDLTDEDAVVQLVAGIEAGGHPIAALIHIAGGFVSAPLVATTAAQFDGQVALNLRSLFLCTREVVRRMMPRGAGRVVAVGSKTALEPGANVAAYAASKAGVHAFVRATAEELRGTGIGVYAVLPSIIDTPANRAAMPTADPARWTSPAEIASVIGLLLKDETGIATGALVPVYGA